MTVFMCIGGLFGLAIALAVSALIPHVGFLVGFLLGFGLTGLGMLIGRAADQ